MGHIGTLFFENTFYYFLSVTISKMEDADDALERNVNESKEELKQWKDERIKSLQTPDIRPDDEKSDKQHEECNKSLEDVGTPTKKSSSLNNAIKEKENLTSKLLYVTKENTKLLQEIGKLKQQQMQLEESLKDITDNPRDNWTPLLPTPNIKTF